MSACHGLVQKVVRATVSCGTDELMRSRSMAGRGMSTRWGCVRGSDARAERESSAGTGTVTKAGGIRVAVVNDRGQLHHVVRYCSMFKLFRLLHVFVLQIYVSF